MNASAQRLLVLGLTVALASMSASAALAQRHGGGGGAGGSHAASAPRQMSAPARPAQPAPQAARPEPQPARPAAPAGGFDLGEDTAPAPIPAPARATTHYRQPAQTTSHTVDRPVSRTANDAVRQGHRPTLIGNLGYGGRAGGHRVLANPQYHGNAWGWNRGVAWYPAPSYYGGGFWGPFGLDAGIASFGAVDYDDGTYDSYQVETESPGAQLLENYRLTQEQCGAPNLVVIFGPDDSVICADPNELVAAGDYQLDPSDLTIVSVDS